jgi:hypothetical protein
MCKHVVDSDDGNLGLFSPKVYRGASRLYLLSLCCVVQYGYSLFNLAKLITRCLFISPSLLFRSLPYLALTIAVYLCISRCQHSSLFSHSKWWNMAAVDSIFPSFVSLVAGNSGCITRNHWEPFSQNDSVRQSQPRHALSRQVEFRQIQSDISVKTDSIKTDSI